MAVLSRDEFFERVQSIVGTDTSDNSITFIEDMTDTYNNLEDRANVDGNDWERRYHELDNSWKEKYKRRFFTGDTSRIKNEVENEVVETRDIDYDDLFE